MILRRGWARLVLEVAFIIVVAAVTRILGFATGWIIALVVLAWLLSAIFERSMSLRAPPGVTGVEPAPEEVAAVNGDPVVEPRTEPLLEPPPRRRRGVLARLFDRRALDEGSARPARRAAEPIAPTDVEPRACSTCGRPIPVDRLLAIPDATQCLDCKRGESISAEAEGLVAVAGAPPAESTVAPAPQAPVRDSGPVEGVRGNGEVPPAPPEETAEAEAPVSVLAPAEPGPVAPPVAVAQEPTFEALPEPEPAPVAEPQAPPAPGPRAWNLWELERLVRERTGQGVTGDEESQFLLVYLREFADPNGYLPPDFDGLVRESFSELLG